MRESPGMAESDEKLMQRTSGGDLAAFGELFDRHQPSVYAFLIRFLGNATLAEDVVQDVFLRVWRYRHSFDPSHRFTPWIYGIARRTALTEAGRPCREELSLDQLATDRDEMPAGVAADGFHEGLDRELALREQVRRALQELPADQ